jgi:transposase
LKNFVLSADQETRVRCELKQPGSVQAFRRATALLAVHQGRPVNLVASVLGVTRQTIYNWLECCDAARPVLNLEDAPRAGRPSIGLGKLDLLLDLALQKSPGDFGCVSSCWTTARLRLHVISEHGPVVSEETIRRRLRRLGYHWSDGRYIRKYPPESPLPAALSPENRSSSETLPHPI